MKIKIEVDHTDEIMRDIDKRIQAALEECGQKAVAEADRNINKGVPRHAGSWYKGKGASGLRGSVSYQVQDDTCYVGSNSEYAIYNEYGTGIYVEDGTGRKSPWAYQDENGTWHQTRGMSPLHFLKNALADHIEAYKEIFEKHLKN